MNEEWIVDEVVDKDGGTWDVIYRPSQEGTLWNPEEDSVEQ